MKLAGKVAVMFLLLGSFVLLIVGGFTFFSLRKQTVKAFNQRQVVLASQTMLAIDRLLYERYQDINEMASGELRDAFSDHREFDLLDIEERLFSLKEFSGPWDLIAIVDEQAQVIISTNDDMTGKALVDGDPNFDAYQAAIEGEVYYSDALISPETGRITVIFAAPFKKITWTEYSPQVIMAQFSLPTATELLDIPIATSYLFNEQGVLISTTDPSNQDKIFSFNIHNDPELKVDHSAESHDAMGFLNKKDVLHISRQEPGYLSYKGNNWMLILETPESVVLGEVNKVAFDLLIAMIPITIITVIISMLVAMRVVVDPVSKLTNYIYEIGSKKSDLNSLDLKMFQTNRSDEIGILWQEFGEMILRVKNSTNQVTNQVLIAKKEHARLLASITDLPMGFLLVNSQGKVELSNKAIKKIFNLKDSLSDLSQIKNLISKKLDLNQLCQKSRKTKKSYLVKEVEFGSNQYLRIFVIPVAMGIGSKEEVDNVIIFEDITEEKLLSQTRDEFFAVASHELRTPLTSIRGNVSLITEYFGDKIKNKDMKGMLADIYDSSTRLISIVEDFLDVSRLDQKQIEYNLESFDLLALIKESVREFKQTASKKNLTLSIKKEDVKSALVKADKNRTKQVIVNLLANAIKFTSKGSIEIEVISDAKKVEVSVIDSGVGIASENQKMLFRKFTQAGRNHLTRDATQGTGLGLYISKMLVEGMGGEITLKDSQLDKGSTFVFSLPVAQNVESKTKQKT